MKKEEIEHFGIISYVLGWLSIIFGILQPVLGFGFGITGLILINKMSLPIAKKAKNLNTIGIIISIIVTILFFAAGFYLSSKGLLNTLT